MIIILFLTRFESTFLKASNSVEARLESKENSESGQSQIYNAGDRWNVFFLSQWLQVVEVTVYLAPGILFRLLCLPLTGDQSSNFSFFSNGGNYSPIEKRLLSDIEWRRQLAHLTSVLASGGPVLAEHLTCLGNPSDDPQVSLHNCDQLWSCSHVEILQQFLNRELLLT